MHNEIEDGMGCAGLVPTAAEKRADAADERARRKTELLRSALGDLIRGYVSMLESARERILFYSRTCDDVTTIERGDPNLRKAREVLQQTR